MLRIQVTDLDEPLSEWQGTITLNPPLRENEERTIPLSNESCNHSFLVVTSNNEYLELPQLDTCEERKLIVFTQRPPSPPPVLTDEDRLRIDAGRQVTLDQCNRGNLPPPLCFPIWDWDRARSNRW